MGSSTAMSLLIVLGVAVVQFGLGMAVAWWLKGGRQDRSLHLESKAHAERSRQLLQRIEAVVGRLTDDVGQHASRMEAVNERLTATQHDTKIEDVVLDAMDQMLQANERLKSQLTEAESKFQQQRMEIESYITDARTDALTGVFNRRMFDDELTRRFAQWRRQKTPFTLAMVDVDHFKKVNDVHGHVVGDQVLRGVAQTLGHEVREMDILARFGGEEFAIILPGTTVEDARVAAERLRNAITAGRYMGKAEFQVTASVGLAQPLDDDDPETLIRRADAAMYAAKRNGRNCAYLHSGSDCEPVDPTTAKPPAREQEEGELVGAMAGDGSVPRMAPGFVVHKRTG